MFPGGLRVLGRSLAALAIVLSLRSVAQGAVVLDALGTFLTGRGYAGSQMVNPDNHFRLLIKSNGKPGNLIVDTGAPNSVIFRESLRKLGLTETKTEHVAVGMFGGGSDRFGMTKVQSFATGNCELANVPVLVISDPMRSGRRNADGLFGFREMVKFGAVLDLGNRLLLINPKGLNKSLSPEIRTLLVSRGFTPVPLSVFGSHIRVAGAINGMPCRYILDTGSYLSLIDSEVVKRAKVRTLSTRIRAQGVGASGGMVGMAKLASIRLGNYEIRNPSATVAPVYGAAIDRGKKSEAAGFLGIEYLGMNSAVIDFNSGTLYLRPKSRR